MKIDAHNHPDWMGHNYNKFISNMKEHSIDITWLLTWDCPEDEFDNGCKDMFSPKVTSNGPFPLVMSLSYLEKAPDKFILGYAPDPRKADSIDKLESAIELYGVRVYGELKLRMMYDNPDALRMFRFCGKKGLPVTVHIDYEFDNGSRYPRPNWWYGGGIEAFERAIIACPETNFLGHAPGFWSHISGDDQCNTVAYPTGKVMPGGKIGEMLRKYPNLYCDLSAGSARVALTRDPEFTKEFIIEFQDRLLFARDTFDGKLQGILESFELSNDILAKIYSGNALKLVPIEINKEKI